MFIFLFVQKSPVHRQLQSPSTARCFPTSGGPATVVQPGGSPISQELTGEETVDPFGNEETFQRTAYRSVNFALSSEFPHIEIKDSPKSTKDFVNKLLELCNFSLTVTPLSVNLLGWVNGFQKCFERAVIVDSIKLSDLELEEGVSAKVLLKGSRDVRDAAFRLAPKKKYHLDKLQVKVKIDEKYVSIHLSNTGAATISSDFFEELLPLLRTSLPTPVTSKG